MALSLSDKVPGATAVFDSSQASGGVSAGPFVSVILAQMTSGTATALDYLKIASAEDAALKWGNGSMIHVMAINWFRNNGNTDLYGVGIADDGGATEEEKTLTFTGPATAGGTIFLYVNGELIRIGVADGDTDADIAANVAAAITALVDLPYTAAAALGVVTLTAKNGGTVGDQNDVRINLRDNEELPAGVGLVIVQSVPGATDPGVAGAIAAVPDDIVNLWITPYTNATDLGLLQAELETRWGETVQLDGTGMFAADQDTVSNVVTAGDALDSERLCGIDSGLQGPVPAYILAAQTTAEIALSASVDVARPFTTLPIKGAIGDTNTDKRSRDDQRQILDAGISTRKIDSVGNVEIQRMITTYKTNQAGSPDEAYLNLNTVLQLSYIRQTFNNFILARYPRHKLADDGTTYGAGQPVVTPMDLKIAAIAWYDVLSALAIVDPAQRDLFISDSVFTRDVSNRSRVNYVMPPTLVGQFYQLDGTIQFRR